MLTFASLMLGTLVSEDLACITAGLLVRRGVISLFPATAACTLGIFIGDLGLWSIGRLSGNAIFAWSWIGPSVQFEKARLQSWLKRHAGQAILVSRFLPGTRLPLYVVAGLIGVPGSIFASWALLATIIWTPILVLLTTALGDAFSLRISSVVGPSWATDAVLAAVVLALLRARRIPQRQGAPANRSEKALTGYRC